MRRRLMSMIACLVAAVVLVPARAGFAQQGGAPRAPRGGNNQAQGTSTPLDSRPISPAEVRKMFDSYAMMQAQEQLKISNDQFPKFLMQYKALLEVRRTATQERNKLLQELRKMNADAQTPEAQVKERIKALRDVEERSHSDVRKAYDEIDKLLDVRQQARFRVFEQQMEQRMLQLVARARQSSRPKAVK
jgi:hypothetical protein